jgi:hypothetical protein
MKRRYTKYLVVLICLFSLSVQFFVTNKTFAVTGPYGVETYYGWFSGNSFSSYDGAVIKNKDCSGGPADAFSAGQTDKASFIRVVKRYLAGLNMYGSDCLTDKARAETGAKFIIQTMRSTKNPDGTWDLKRDWPIWRWAGDTENYNRQVKVITDDWEARINMADVRIISKNQSFTMNSQYYDGPTYKDDMFYSERGTVTKSALVFQRKNNSGVWEDFYAIKKDCGNPVGDGLTGLPPPSGGGGDITPTSSAIPTLVEPGEDVVFSHGVTADGSLTGTYTIDRYSKTPDAALPGGVSGPFTVTNGSINPAIPTNRSYSTPIDAVIGSQYCEKLSLTNMSGGIANKSSEACATVIARPIVKFSGSDVDFCGSGGSVHTWAKLKGGAYVGSSSQYALFIYNAISGDGSDKKGFFSGAITTVTDPKKLTFANIGAGVGTFGKDWGDTKPTCTNYFSDEYGTNGEKLPIDRTGIETPVSGSVASRIIALGTHTTTYINGDAVISGKIVYADSNSWGSASNIPSYRLIVSGNIYIDPSVTQLDGFYFAGSNIYTCSTGSSYDPHSANYFTDCNDPLTVNGAFQALGSIKYWRTGGTLNLDTPAETFTFSPEMFLTSRWMGSSSFSGDQIQSLKSMPPVF